MPIPGSSVGPMTQVSTSAQRTFSWSRKGRLTSVDILVNQCSHLARLGRIDPLRRQTRALRPKAPRRIHSPLQGVIPPPEDVIRMLTKTRLIPRGQEEGLGAVLGPLGRVVEGRRVPDDFVH